MDIPTRDLERLRDKINGLIVAAHKAGRNGGSCVVLDGIEYYPCHPTMRDRCGCVWLVREIDHAGE